MPMDRLKIYFDTSVLNRIFDDQSQPKIYLEATAMLVLFQLIEKGKITLVMSEVNEYENDKNPFEERKSFIRRVLSKSSIYQAIETEIVDRAKQIEKMGIKGIDALHLACAEKMESDYFLTCDNEILRKYDGTLKVNNPTEFIFKYIVEI